MCFNFHIKKEFWSGGGGNGTGHLIERQNPAVKEGLKSKFSKYGNPVKAVTSSGAHGNTHLDPSVSAISSQGPEAAGAEQPGWPQKEAGQLPLL